MMFRQLLQLSVVSHLGIKFDSLQSPEDSLTVR